MSRSFERFHLSSADESQRQAARTALQRDGAVILTNLQPTDDSEWQAVAAAVPNLLFDKSQLLLEKHDAAAVHTENATLGLDGQALLPHTDGYVWGDCYPDLVILICQQPSQGGVGGENYLIDGEDVVRQLQENQAGDDSVFKLLKEVPVDHTERSNESGVADGAESIVPVWRWLDYSSSCWWKSDVSQRMCWRRMISVASSLALEEKKDDNDNNVLQQRLSIWQPLDETAEEMDHALLQVDQAIETVSQEAKRFQLQAGEALIVDNFRMLHAREAFAQSSGGRFMWRVWSWTNGSMGLPPGVAAAEETGEEIPATVFTASNAILHAQS